MFKTLASGFVISAIAISGLAFTAGAVAAATAEPAKMADTSKGQAWVDGKGMTLYVFGKDETGKSNTCWHLEIVPDAGHSAFEPGTIHELVSATDRFSR